jgi:predicted SnoaL-like aldol condensation-catalyzing enzyme
MEDIDRDPSIVGRYFAPGYTQHNPTLPDGPGPIPAMIAGFPDNFQYEPGMAVAEGDLVMVHGRYTGWGPKPMVAVDIFRIADGRVVPPDDRSARPNQLAPFPVAHHQ